MNTTLATVNAIRRANNQIAQNARIGMYTATSREIYLLNFFRLQEARTLLTLMGFYGSDNTVLKTLIRRTHGLLANPEYCGENHHKHYLQAIKKLKND